jgi:hypothetical protein
MSTPKFMDFEFEAHKLLKDGGTKNKPFKFINEIQSTMRVQIDSQLEQVFTDCKLVPNFFITSSLMDNIWTKITKDGDKSNFKFKCGLDLFK